jgi:hypothetical protein
MKLGSLQKQVILLVLTTLFWLSSHLTLSASTRNLESNPAKSQDTGISLPRITIGQDGRSLVTETGNPFFWLGDTAWEMFARLTQEEVEQYLENRRLKGFNVIQVVILTEHNLNVPNAYDDIALVDNDPLKPNEEYFAFVDWMIAKAAEKGLYVGLLPTWGDKVNKMQGKGPVIFNEANAQLYGAYLGKRYKDATNVIWILGGDRNVANNAQLLIWRAMAAGIEAEAGASALITYHPRGESSSATWFNEDTAFDFNMVQSGHNSTDLPIWDMIADAYKLTPAKPVFDAEINYEDGPINLNAQNGYFTDYDVRKQAYRSVFAGGSGVTYGHQSVWQFYGPDRRGIASPKMYWYEALDRPGATQLRYLATLMLSRPYLNRIPDQGLILSLETATQNRRSSHVRATRASDGSYAFVYLPTNQAVQVDLSKISGTTVRAWWYNPITGRTVLIGEYLKATHTAFTFTPPTAYKDAVLVLDDASQEFSLPGGNPVNRVINLNGPALVINDVAWETGIGAEDLTVTNGKSFCNQDVVLVPTTDPEMAKMLRCSVYGSQIELALANMPNGNYEVALHVWEDNKAQVYNIEIEGRPVLTGYNSGDAGTWARLGPWIVTVSDNQLNIVASGGHANLSGLEVRQAPSED